MSLNIRQKDFSENGFCVVKNVFDESDMEDIFLNFYNICYFCALNNNIQNDSPSISEVSYPANIKDLDLLVMAIFKKHKGFLAEIYDTFSYSLSFMRFLGNKKVESISKELLNLDENSALYGFTNRMRIDPPGDERRTYGWHQEIFYNVPNSNFLQTWCPMMRSTSIDNGTIELKKGSHKEGISGQSWQEVEGRVTQIIIDPSVSSKYKTTKLEMNVGDVLFFDSHLFHKSGKNSTKDEVRFSLVGTWNDVSYKKFRAPIPEFKFRTLSPKEYFDSLNS